MNERLMIFAKAPTPGRVKTRLIPALGADGAARLHAACVADVIARHRRPDRALTVWRAGDLDHPLWAELAVDLAEQPAGDLGARLEVGFGAELAGDARVVVLGTDSPTLPPALVDQAFAALSIANAVIGPACDGGYYLLGLRGSVPPVFSAIDWGTADVLAQTLEAFAAAGIHPEVLPFWYDLDRPDDLRLLRALAPSLAAPRPHRTLAALGLK